MYIWRTTSRNPCPTCGYFTDRLIEIKKKIVKCGNCIKCKKHKAYKAIRKPKVDCPGCLLKWRLLHERF